MTVFIENHVVFDGAQLFNTNNIKINQYRYILARFLEEDLKSDELHWYNNEFQENKNVFTI